MPYFKFYNMLLFLVLISNYFSFLYLKIVLNELEFLTKSYNELVFEYNQLYLKFSEIQASAPILEYNSEILTIHQKLGSIIVFIAIIIAFFTFKSEKLVDDMSQNMDSIEPMIEAVSSLPSEKGLSYLIQLVLRFCGY